MKDDMTEVESLRGGHRQAMSWREEQINLLRGLEVTGGWGERERTPERRCRRGSGIDGRSVHQDGNNEVKAGWALGTRELKPGIKNTTLCM